MGRPIPSARVGLVLLAVVVVVLVLLAVAVSLSSQSGLRTGFSWKPAVTLTVSSKSASGVDILVAGIQPTAAPTNFKVNVANSSSITYGTAVPMPTSPSGRAYVTVGAGASSTTFSVQWQNPYGSGNVTQGDHFLVTETSGAYASGTMFSFLLIWSDGSTLNTISWLV